MSLTDKAHFGNYTPASFGWGSRDPFRDHGLLVPFAFNGVSFGSMHRDVHGLFTALLTELVPHIPGGLKAGTCGCYNPGSVTVGGDRSFHAYGIAIDINWSANPMYHHGRPTGKYTLPALTSSIARKYGCEWGGDWTYPEDWMHVEVHLSPAVARTVSPYVHPAAPASQLEEIMALKRGSAEYNQTLDDLADRVWSKRLRDASEKESHEAGTFLVATNRAAFQTLGHADSIHEKFRGEDGHQHSLETGVKHANGHPYPPRPVKH